MIKNKAHNIRGSMKLVFDCYLKDNNLEPTCYSLEENELNPLTGYLTDTTGGSYGEYLKFLKKSLDILNDDEKDIDISSNSWGVNVFDTYVEIYFLYDENNENYKLKMNKFAFSSIINEWILFLQEKGFDTNPIQD
ncbi:hypothetical protein A4G20_02415 [Pasteurellaceae bacterium RH1A]|nr:hypothetical protein A4G20_02415 [Pasteurellaceae bacterium RH1A]